MDSEGKLLALAMVLLTVLILGIVAICYGTDVVMANKGLCYVTVQVPNNNPLHQYEKCR